MSRKPAEIPEWVQALNQRLEGWYYFARTGRTKKQREIAEVHALLDIIETTVTHSDEFAAMVNKMGDDMRSAIQFALGTEPKKKDE